MVNVMHCRKIVTTFTSHNKVRRIGRDLLISKYLSVIINTSLINIIIILIHI